MPVEQQHSATHRFTVIFEEEDEGGYHVFCPTLPGCHTPKRNGRGGHSSYSRGDSTLRR